MFIVTLTYLRPLAELDALMPQHVAWLKEHYDAGLFIASGRQKPRKGGVILTRTVSRARLQAILAKDPFVKSGCATAEVVEFTPSMTAPGAEALREI
ncbi:YciI family protein [Variovorax sp. LT1P1]|uniref:YciI family protein n=1 Tax=Variovorax sp. LT1P1 TaxID=3443730 RepID=UPI003F452E67